MPIKVSGQPLANTKFTASTLGKLANGDHTDPAIIMPIKVSGQPLANTKFTASTLGKLANGDHTDPAIIGLQFRVRDGARKVSRTWLFRYKWRTEWVRLTLGHFPDLGLADAREIVAKHRKHLTEGIDPRRATQRRTQMSALPRSKADPSAPAAHDRHSIEFLADEYIRRHMTPRVKRPEYYRAIIDRDVLPVWKGRDARTIKPREVIELLDGIVDRGSKCMANHTAGILSQMFKYGIHRDIVEQSPVVLLFKPGGKEKPRNRALSDKELRIFFAEGSKATKTDKLRHVITLLLLTGQRRGELAAAQWRHVDFKDRTWVIPPENSKTGVGHTLPLSEWACAEFRALQALANGSRWVLPDSSGKDQADAKLYTRGLARHLERLQKAGIEKFVLHDLRRTCRTGLAVLKIQPHIAERCLNHVQEKIPGTYDVHDYLDEKRAALTMWADHLEGLRP